MSIVGKGYNQKKNLLASAWVEEAKAADAP